MRSLKVFVLGMVGSFFGVAVLAGVAYWQDIFTVDKNGAVFFRIDDSGNIGIGSAASPGSRLTVQGTGTTSSTSSLNVSDSTGTSMMYVRDDGRVGIGTTGPAAKMDVQDGDVYSRRAGDTVYPVVNSRCTSTNGSPHLILSRARGTAFGSESATQSGDSIGNISFRGHDGTAFISMGSVDVRSVAEENFSSSARGASLRFITTATGTVTQGERMRITHDGNVGIGTASQFGGGVRVVGIANATTVPSSNPSGGGVLYADAGALKYRGSSGTVTTIAPAEPHCPDCGRDFVVEWTNEKYGHLMICMWCFTDNFSSVKGVIKRAK